MRTVKWLKEQLSKYPDDYLCYAYEGEDVGLVVISENGKSDFISCREIEHDTDSNMLDGVGSACPR